MSKYLEFKLLATKPKTLVYQIRSKSNYNLLGEIKWYPQWRQYCFFPSADSLFNTGCLSDITDFVEDLNRQHKEKRRKEAFMTC